MQKRLRKRKILLGLFAFAAVMILLYFGLWWVEKQTLKPENRGDLWARFADEEILVDGVAYRPKPNLFSFLFLGIDTRSDMFREEEIYGGAGQSDFLLLAVFDPGEKTIAQIPIDRDTVTPVTAYSVRGDVMGTRDLNITLAFSYGDGKEKRCQMAVDAVRGLLLNVPVNGYLAMNLDGIPVLNDMLGGVEVTVTDDFSGVDASLVQGAVIRLNGQQAETFVRSRKQMTVSSNEARMARQRVYLDQALSLLDEKLRQDEGFVGAMYDALGPYVTSSLSRGELVSAAWKYRNYERLLPLEITGVHRIGEKGYMQFFPDAASVQETVLRVFYQPVTE